jgi:hypothetical protein
MRFAVAALCVLALTGSANADYILKGQFRAPCKMTPPTYALHEPTVPYTVETLPQAKAEHRCTAGKMTIAQPMTACAMPPGWAGNDNWIIVVSDFLSPTDLACVMVYEKAHLPPNNWEDTAWEKQVRYGTLYITRRNGSALH